MEDGPADRVAVQRARQREMNVRADPEVDQDVGAGVGAEGVVQLACVDLDGDRVHATPVQGPGHLAGRAQAARRALAPLLPNLCLKRYLSHGLPSWNGRGGHCTGLAAGCISRPRTGATRTITLSLSARNPSPVFPAAPVC